jgi:hypothetical protein
VESGFQYPSSVESGYKALPRYVSREVLERVDGITLETEANVERGYARGTSYIDRSIALPKDRYGVASVVLHEFGHHIERAVPGALGAATAFRTQMAAREQSGPRAGQTREPTALNRLVPGGGGYRDNEEAYEGRFYDPYVGKVYPATSRATEVVSMGLQAMYDDPLGFAKKAPEHFRLTWNILRGKVPS